MSHTQNFNTYNIPKPPFEVPPLSRVYDEYRKACPDRVLRFGQWFFNRFLKQQSGPTIDKLYNSTNQEEIMWILIKMYEDYQWPKY